MAEAIIGVIGTLVGTILGWGLNSFSQRGKLNVSVSSWEDSMKMRDTFGGMTSSCSKEKTEYFTCQFDLNLYNSSTNIKVMRFLEIEFYDNSKKLFSLIPKDNDTRSVSGGRAHYDEINVINTLGRSADIWHITSGLGSHNEKFQLLWYTNRVYLAYRDERNRIVKVFIKEVDYNNYFTS